MKTGDIQHIELKYLELNDYQELKTAMISAYTNMPDSYWEEKHISTLIKKFPKGQAVIKING
ncbi:MAG: carbon-nitrogen hydrolase, partial [Dokdonia donghaensis]|nr:carbon-nitrogen hydrolase [Dokdonia donghaensis]